MPPFLSYLLDTLLNVCWVRVATNPCSTCDIHHRFPTPPLSLLPQHPLAVAGALRGNRIQTTLQRSLAWRTALPQKADQSGGHADGSQANVCMGGNRRALYTKTYELRRPIRCIIRQQCSFLKVDCVRSSNCIRLISYTSVFAPVWVIVGLVVRTVQHRTALSYRVDDHMRAAYTALSKL